MSGEAKSMNTFTGKQWKALMAHCMDKRKVTQTTDDNLRWPVLSNGHLIFSDKNCIVTFKVPFVEVHAADPEYIPGGLMRLDQDLSEKILVKDIFMITEDGLYKNGKLISPWRYVHNGTVSSFYKLVKDSKESLGKMTTDSLQNCVNYFGIGHKYITKIADLADALGGAIKLYPVGGERMSDTTFKVPTFVAEFGPDITGVYAPVRL